MQLLYSQTVLKYNRKDTGIERVYATQKEIDQLLAQGGY